jgi:hypothetical protein
VATSVETGGRPAVDIVTPFAGSAEELDSVVRCLASIDRRTPDTCKVAHNRLFRDTYLQYTDIAVVGAGERHSSYHARNRGAASGDGEWIVFLDGDVVPPPDIVDRYFDPPPGDDVGLLAGGVRDEEPGAGAPFAVRYSSVRRTLSQSNTMDGRWAYAQTANCAVRRSAFEAIGGFRADVRSGGDADLCFRLRAAGWKLESRPGAEVVHRNRDTMRGLLRQRMRHGSGAAWLDREYPGSAPGHGNRLGLAKWTFGAAPAAALRYLRGPREEARVALADIAVLWALELGRLLPNEVRPRRRGWARIAG